MHAANQASHVLLKFTLRFGNDKLTCFKTIILLAFRMLFGNICDEEL